MQAPRRLHHLLSRVGVSGAESPALTLKKETLSYGQLWDGVARLATGLRSSGLAYPQRVAVYMEKRFETVTTIFAASTVGGVFVPINPLLRSRQVAHILVDSSAATLVTTSERYELIRGDLDACENLENVVIVGDLARLSGRSHYRVISWADLATDEPMIDGAEGTDADVAAILYTSGSTGSPKGVVLSHRNLIVGAESVSEYLENGPDDVILAALPLSFDAGFSQLTTGFNAGAHVVMVNYLLPREVVALCADHGVTGLTCVPPLWMQIADQPWPEDATASLRYFANTGGRMPKTTLDRLREVFPNAKPFLMYGLTEAFRSTYLDPSQVDHRPDSIGKAIPNAEVLVVRPDGSECDPGEEGELVHRGALVSMGYWNDPDRTAIRFRPAPGRPDEVATPELAVWSGDTVVRDEEGFIYFVGRSDEMIKTSGYRISPTEIEEVVYSKGVGAAAAFGIDDLRLGHRIVLVVSPLEGREVDAEALLGALRQDLPMYMVPKEVVVRDELPRSPNGKLDRNLIRQELGS